MTKQTFTNVTLYAPLGVMSSNIVKVECRTLTIEVGPYAQYTKAVKLTWIGKGQRRERFHTETFQPYAVVVEGYGQIDPDGLYDESTRRTTGGVTTERSRYSSCSPKWQEDFNAKLAARGVKIVADFRGHDPCEQ